MTLIKRRDRGGGINKKVRPDVTPPSRLSYQKYAGEVIDASRAK
jgi:hypothetical protein